ncbi:phosphate starvation-inducible protein (PhoH), partial [Candidatus Magnetobacterium bavaricum]
MHPINGGCCQTGIRNAIVDNTECDADIVGRKSRGARGTRGARGAATVTLEIPLETDRDLDFLKRDLNSSLKLIEDALGVIVSTRGNKVFIQGDDDQVRITQKLILDIYHVKREGHLLRTEDIAYTLNNLIRTGQMNLKDVFDHYIPVASKARYVIPKTETQMAYIEAIRTYDIVVG